MSGFGWIRCRWCGGWMWDSGRMSDACDNCGKES